MIHLCTTTVYMNATQHVYGQCLKLNLKKKKNRGALYRRWGSNPRSPACKAGVLTARPRRHVNSIINRAMLWGLCFI